MAKADNTIAIYRRLRDQSLWRLLASDNGPTVIGLLQTHLFDGERRLPASIFYERLHRDLQDLLAQGEDLPRTGQAYVADWLAAGYLERRFPPGASEEEYELSAAAAAAIRFAAGLVEPHTMATESRLAVVIQQLVRLAEETETNPETRIATLLSERERIDSELQLSLDTQTEPWGVKVHRVEIRDVGLPEQMQRAMARQAEAERERRAKIIAAEGELQASQKLGEAADVIAGSPGALQLRQLQTMVEISAERNSTIIFPIPIELLEAFQAISRAASGR